MIFEMARRIPKYLIMKRLIQSGKITTRVVKSIAFGLEKKVPYARSEEHARTILAERRLNQSRPVPQRFAPFKIWRPKSAIERAA